SRCSGWIPATPPRFERQEVPGLKCPHDPPRHSVGPTPADDIRQAWIVQDRVGVTGDVPEPKVQEQKVKLAEGPRVRDRHGELARPPDVPRREGELKLREKAMTWPWFAEFELRTSQKQFGHQVKAASNGGFAS